LFFRWPSKLKDKVKLKVDTKNKFLEHQPSVYYLASFTDLKNEVLLQKNKRCHCPTGKQSRKNFVFRGKEVSIKIRS
jgi:hypothetical protein